MDLVDFVLILGVLFIPCCLSFLAGMRTSGSAKKPQLEMEPGSCVEKEFFWKLPGAANKLHSKKSCNAIEAKSDAIRVEICKSCKEFLRELFCKHCSAKKAQ